MKRVPHCILLAYPSPYNTPGGMIKGLTRAGAWSKSGRSLNMGASSHAWQMAQACYHGNIAHQAGNEADFEAWLYKWNRLQLGPKCKLPRSCAAQFAALFEAIDHQNATAFMPRRSPVPLQNMVFLCLDSAGLSDEDPLSKRACGGWAYNPMWDEIRYFQERWCQEILVTAHSTIMESANGLSCLQYAMEHWQADVYVECYDSCATVDIFRSMSSRSFEMRKLLRSRQALLQRFPQCRALIHWQNREGRLNAPPPLFFTTAAHSPLTHHEQRGENPQSHQPTARADGYIADAFTKYETAAYTSALQDRFPHLSLAIAPEPKPRNMINSPAFAATWTAKDNEDFDS